MRDVFINEEKKVATVMITVFSVTVLNLEKFDKAYNMEAKV